MYDLIIFDCDGTLVNSEYLNNKVSSDMLIEFGLSEYTPEKCVAEFTGNTWTNIKIKPESQHDIKLPEDFISQYIARVHQEMDKAPTPIEGAVEFVKASKERTKICVASNGERANVRKFLSLHDYDDYFREDNTFTRVQVPQGKPEPDIFFYAAEKMKADPSRCLVIEDSPTGVTAGVAAGMDVFGFTGASDTPEFQGKMLQKAGAKRIFTDFIHIAEALGY